MYLEIRYQMFLNTLFYICDFVCWSNFRLVSQPFSENRSLITICFIFILILIVSVMNISVWWWQECNWLLFFTVYHTKHLLRPKKFMRCQKINVVKSNSCHLFLNLKKFIIWVKRTISNIFTARCNYIL